MIKQLVVATSLLISSDIFAKDSDWGYINKSDNFTSYYDASTLEKVHGSKDKEIQGWFKLVLNTDKKEGDHAGDYNLNQMQIRCTDKHVKFLRVTGYSYKGEMKFDKVIKDSKYIDTVPDTHISNITDLMCLELRK